VGWFLKHGEVGCTKNKSKLFNEFKLKVLKKISWKRISFVDGNRLKV
jgi:hypothetical protein